MFTLILPDWLRRDDEPLPPLHTPALNRLLRYGRFQAAGQSRAELYQTYLADRLAQPENHAFASPVYQQTGLNSVQLIGAGLAIDDDEARQWCTGLNELYDGDARFTPLRADLWQIELPQAIQWHTPPLWDVIGTLDDAAKAQGTAAAQWLQLSTEIQMWLHTHPSNRQRTVPINGLWLWHGPHTAPNPFQAALLGSDSPWRQQSSLNTEDMPHDWHAWQRVCADANCNINQTALFSEQWLLSAQTGDVWHYADCLAQWEQHFFTPIWQDLAAGRLNGLRIICQQGSLSVPAKAQRRFWRRAKTFNGHRLQGV